MRAEVLMAFEYTLTTKNALTDCIQSIQIKSAMCVPTLVALYPFETIEKSNSKYN